jgi:hypothetical protein
MIMELNQELLEHHERFPLFGIILFTEAHAHVVKMLKDRQYYAALNEISGDQLVVFATMLFRGEYEYPQPWPGTLSMMREIWKEPKENEKVLSWFGVRDSRVLPMFVLFGVDDNELYYQKHPLKSESVEDVFNSLQQVLSAIAVQTQENRGEDRRDLFKKAQWEIKKLQARQKVKDILGTVSQFRGIAGV